MEAEAAQQLLTDGPIKVTGAMGFERVKEMLQAVSPAHAEYFENMFGLTGEDWRQEAKRKCLLPPYQQRICETMAALVFQNQNFKAELAKHNIPIPEDQ